jgi:hypothetical protein
MSRKPRGGSDYYDDYQTGTGNMSRKPRGGSDYYDDDQPGTGNMSRNPRGGSDYYDDDSLLSHSIQLPNQVRKCSDFVQQIR